MMHRSVQLVVLGCMSCLLSMGLHGQRFTFHSYGQSDGLKNMNVRNMLQDRAGFLWVGTEDGLFRFDGANFQQMSFDGETNFITGLAEDAAGRIWVSTNHTLHYFDPSGAHAITDGSQSFDFDMHASLAASPSNRNQIYFVSGHTLHTATLQGNSHSQLASVFSPSQLSKRPELNSVSSVQVEANGQLWIGCGDGICSVTERSFRHYTTADGLPVDSWQVTFLDRSGVFWVRGKQHIVRLEPHSTRFTCVLDGLAVSSGARDPGMAEDSLGRVLINNMNGVARWQNGRWQQLKTKRDLPPFEVTALLSDRQGSVWLGLEGHGLGRWLGYDEVESWTEINGLSGNVVWSFARDASNHLWIASKAGLDRLDRDSDQMRPERDLQNHAIRRIQSLALTRNGHVWSGSDDGKIVDYDPASRTQRMVGQVGGVFQLLSDSSDRVWVCTFGGLFSVDGTDPHAALIKTQDQAGPPGRVYHGLQDPAKTLWFTTDSGLYRFQNGLWTHIVLPVDYHPGVATVLALAPDGSLWLSGDRPSLTHLRIRGSMAEVLEHFNGFPLSSDNLYFVKIDRRGWLWVGSGSGVDVFNGQLWRHFNTTHGLIWNDLNGNSVLEDDDGSLWFGTSGGISHLLHPERIFTTEPLRLWVGDARIGKALLPANTETEVPWGHEPLTAHLASMDFKREQELGFQYRIEGAEEVWQDTSSHDLRYPPLRPGRYRLAVTAIDLADGQHSAPVYISFRVLPPWWKTRWMIGGEVAAAIFLVFLAWRRSVKMLVARQHRLEYLVQQRTSELEGEKVALLAARTALEEQAIRDSLTGLFNRRELLRRLAMEMARSAQHGTPLAFVMVDVDHFKQVNDQFGHVTGDCVLQEFGKRLRTGGELVDVVGRYGGEEIAIVIPHAERQKTEARVSELQKIISGKLFCCNGHQLPVTCSIGVAWFVCESDNEKTLLERADQALYRAKKNGRNRTVFNTLSAGEEFLIEAMAHQSNAVPA